MNKQAMTIEEFALAELGRAVLVLEKAERLVQEWRVDVMAMQKGEAPERLRRLYYDWLALQPRQ